MYFKHFDLCKVLQQPTNEDRNNFLSVSREESSSEFEHFISWRKKFDIKFDQNESYV